MKATIESTWRVMDVRDARKRAAQVQVFEGTTETGIRFVAYVVRVQLLPADESRRPEFEKEITSSRPVGDDALRALALVGRADV